MRLGREVKLLLSFVVLISVIGLSSRLSDKPAVIPLKSVVAAHDEEQGVLAINHAQSSYQVGEVVDMAISVLNARGNMVCDAELVLTIIDPKQDSATLLSSREEISATPSCKVKDQVPEPDYVAVYKPKAAGVYQVHLTATINDAILTQSSSFTVENDPALVLIRRLPTRIFPPVEYHAELLFKVNQDFKGEVVEELPPGLVVSADSTNYLVMQKNDQQFISWEVDWLRGQEYRLTYNFRSAQQDPGYKEFNRLIARTGDEVVFQEPTPWQLAIDEVSQVGIWRHTAGASPTASWAKVVWGAEDRNDGSIYTRDGGNDDITLPSGRFLLMYQVMWYASEANGRSNPEVGCYKDGALVQGSLGAGYQRSTANDAAWAKGQCIVDSTGSNQISIQHRRDSDANVGTYDANRSWLVIAQLPDDTDYGYYTDGTDTSSDGGTGWNDVPWDTAVESGTAVAQQTSTTFDLAANSEYLILYGVAYENTGQRTARFTQMLSGASHIYGSYGYGYMRNQNNGYGDPNAMFLHRTSGSTETLTVQARRSLLGVPVDGTVSRRTSSSGLWIIELPSTVESFIAYDGTGGQDGTSTLQDLNVFRTEVSGNDAAFMTRTSNTEVQIEDDVDAIVMSAIYIARSTSSGTRLMRETNWEINGTDQTHGTHGIYNRGAYGSQDVWDSVHSPAGFFAFSSGDDLNLEYGEVLDSGWGNGAGSPTTQANYVGFSALNPSSLVIRNTQQVHFRWRDDTTDLNTSGGWLAAEDSNAIGNIGRNTTYRLRIEVANDGNSSEVAARTYELEFADITDAGVATCDLVSTWSGIGDATDEFSMALTAHVDPDGESTTSGLLANSEGYTRVNGEGRENADTTGALGPLAPKNYIELEYSLQADEAAVTGHTYCFRLFDTTGATVLDEYSIYPQVTIDYTLIPNPVLEWGTQSNVSDSAWTTINFTGTYQDPVFICSVHYYNNIGNEGDGTADAVVCRVQNLGATSAQVQLQEPGSSTLANSETIYWMVAEAGAYDTSDIKFEAFTHNSTTTDYKTVGYNGQSASYTQTYTNPVVLGQVQTYNDSNWSSFFSRGIGTTDPPDASNLYVGKHVGEDTTTSRNDETLGVIVFEQGNGTLDSVTYEVRMQGRTIDRIDDSPPQSYTFNTSFSSTPTVALVSVAGVDGVDGPKPALYGANPLSTTAINLTIMDDEIGDTEQTGIPEYVPYIVFASSGTYTIDELAVDQTTYRFYQNADSVQPGTAIGAENTSITDVKTDDIVRIRMSLQVGRSQFQDEKRKMTLQYGQGSTCSAIGTWIDVDSISSSGIWRGYNNTPVDGTTITASLLNGATNTLESYEEENDSVDNPNPIAMGSRGEWDWVVQNNGAVQDADYCFRIVTENDDVLEYTRYPQLKTFLNVVPTVNNVTVNSGADVNLTEATTVAVSWTATVTDSNGYADIDTVEGKLYRSGVTGAEACTNDDNNCYADTSCTLSGCAGNSCTATCEINMQFHAESTDAAGSYPAEYWRGWMEVTDLQSTTGEGWSASGSPEVNTLYALNTDAAIGYGSLLAGEDTGSTNETITITNTGNVGIDSDFSGTDMCTDFPGCVAEIIGVAYQEYSTGTFTYGAGTDLTSGPINVDINLTKPTTAPSDADTTAYWGMGIPSIQGIGTYSGNNTITATSDT